MTRAAFLAVVVLSCAACPGGGGAPGSGSRPGGDAGSGSGGGGAIGGAGDGGPVDGGSTDGGSADGGQVDGGVAETRPNGGGDWPQFRDVETGTSRNPGVWTVAETANLTPLWTLELGQYVYSQPMIAGDAVYFTTAITGRVVAVDAATGAVRWTRELNAPIATTCGGSHSPGFWGAVSVVGDVVYAPSPDGQVYALRKSDGSTIWSSRIADPTAAGHGAQLVASPVVSPALGRLYLGVASSSDCDLIAGYVAMLDLATGAPTVTQLLAPGQKGAGVWTSFSVDEAAGRVYVTTGDAVGAPASEPLSNAIVAFDARTLAVVDHWQDPTTLDDADLGSSPTLFEAGGRRLVAAASKDGFLYTLDRGALSAGPLWKLQLAINDPARPNEAGDPVLGWGSIVSPTFAEGVLYAAGGRTPLGEPGSVVALDPATGALKWKHATPGYVIAPMPAVGDVLFVESTRADFTASTLEVLDAATGAVVRSFPGATASFAAPSVGRGLLIWADANGHATAFAVPHYR